MQREGGFTLIEITLVMVIAGLLFAIALPNMGHCLIRWPIGEQSGM